MQKISTRVFIGASVAFGIIGILVVLTMADNDSMSSALNILFRKLFLVDVCIILPSFALSVASKYLNGRS